MKIGTIILIVVIIILLFWLISSYIINKNVLTTLTNASIQQTIAASSLASSNTPGNSNFAYSIWFYINNWNTRYGYPKILFGRMLETTSTPDPDTGISGKFPAPIVVLGAISNDIDVSLTLYSFCHSSSVSNNYIQDTCSIINILIDHWFNFTMTDCGL